MNNLNTPNKLTVARMAMVPVFMAVLLLEIWVPDWSVFTRAFAGVIFSAAAITDAVDGRMARKYNLITDFGKFLDPIADKMLVLSALICFVRLDMMFLGEWLTVIIILREFAVSALRLVVSREGGEVVSASIWGKLKTVLQMAAVITYLFQDAVGSILGVSLRVWEISLADLVMISAVVMTLISGYKYLESYYPYIDPAK